MGEKASAEGKSIQSVDFTFASRIFVFLQKSVFEPNIIIEIC
jgi:hypothetical protein